ncbi:related to tricarboxylate transport protein, mitochondrial precursor [Phialocephala subalpina]|uniref:Related to tricarboxylate transport protein, mitochondrial n=1 Tax=Phialocephala subalpina TaxID=576137 RepID=A0A1L7X8F0_9HELO|nr:related to tricarboxylate transport protein, mitochondrial precursor [Phialocephala subalpina]
MAPPKTHADTPPLVSLISGGVAGGVEGFLTYPFEFAKTRIQLRSKTAQPTKLPRNPYSVVINIYRTLTPGKNMLAGMTAGVVASVAAVTPTERIKTALIDDARSSHRYKSTIHCIRLIIVEDGFKGLYRGLAGTTLKQASATSFRMGSYNIIKDFEEKRGITQNTTVNFGNGAVAGVVTTVLSQPFDTVKTRSQAVEVTTTMQAITSVLKEEGVRGFWRGTVMRLSRTVFSGGILFTTAEAVSKIITPLIGL